MLSPRLESIKNELFSARREVSLERALLYTESHKSTEGLPEILRRAHATAHILDNVNIDIRKGELIAGNRTLKPRSGIVSPEMDPQWIYDELDILESRPQDKFFISEEDKKIYREKLYPYWKDKCLKSHIWPQIDGELKSSIDLKIVKLNQTDKGQGHIIPDFPRLLDKGLDSLINDVKSATLNDTKNDFYKSALIVLEASKRHILRYADIARELSQNADDERAKELLEIERISKKVSHSAPETFHEACQLLWYFCVMLQYESNASSISLGNFDTYMNTFYTSDIKNGISPEFLRDILSSFWLKTNDVVLIRSSNSAKYFAGFPTGYTITLGGLTPDGKSSVNKLSYLCLDTYADIKLPQPNLGVRLNSNIERAFLNKTSETIRLGTGIPQIFNDEVIVPGFLNRGVSLEDSRDFSVVGCVELSIPGKTYGLHDIALFNLLKLFEVTLQEQKNNEDLTFDGLIEHIKSNIDYYVDLMVKGSNIVDIGHKKFASVPLLSTLVDSCIEKGLDITAGGAKYNFSGVQGIGVANLSDSLYALKSIVFDEKRLSLNELIDHLESNFESAEGEKLRIRLINKYPKYGNDIDAVDNIGSELLRYYNKKVESYKTPRGGSFTPGSYTVSAHVPLGAAVGATSDGRKSGEQLADGGLSPMVGRDVKGPTAVLKSVSKLDNYLTSNGSLLNLKFSPKTLEGISGVNKLSDFLNAFMQLKIQHVQFNVISADTLREAQKNPNDYKGLVVRVAGYSAFFTELSKAIQDDLIARTEHAL
ncbi:MAG: formate C-acetyltransferase [Tissierellales bacterium]|jgi:formate C-acetyltransferase|nr:formate C-acetyltransferase [Tissierellales bacterium]